MKLPVFYMLSFPRSGETMTLRSLEAHSKVRVVNQLYAHDGKIKSRFANYLEDNQPDLVPMDDIKFPLDGKRILVLKNSSKSLKKVKRGFMLVRNPYSIMQSFKGYEFLDDDWKITTGGAERYNRWAAGVIGDNYPKGKDGLELFCNLWNKKIENDLAYNFPVVKYEEIVTSPSDQFERLCGVLGVKYEQSMVDLNKNSFSGIGHGNNDLSRPIDASSLKKYLKMPKPVLKTIRDICLDNLEKFGYQDLPI